VRRNTFVLLALTCLFAVSTSRRAAAAEVPTVTIMQAGADEFQSDIEFLMKLAGKDGEQQWPVVEQILDVFLDGVDGERPMRIDLILGKKPDTRLSVPIAKGLQKAFQQNVGGFIGANPRRMGGGLFLFRPKPPALQYYLRELGNARNPDWGVVAEEKGNLPANFQVLAAIQPLINAGFDLAATVENSDDEDSIKDRRQVILDLEKEVTATLQPLDGETDNEFEMRKLGLGHQFRELERIYADSQQLTLGWTTDQEKKEGQLDLELSALAESDLAKSISELAEKPSRFAAITKSEDSIFFGRVNHALDAMRQKHFTEMFELMENDAKERLADSEDYSDEQKAGITTAIEKGFEMLRAGTKMGVVDGFVDVNLTDGNKGVVGAIRVDDGSVGIDVLGGLKAAGWDVEIGEADGETAVAYHKVTLPENFAPFITSLVGSSQFSVATRADAVYYAAGAGADERIKAVVDAEPSEENDGTFLEAWYRVGPILDVLRERRERRESDLDLSKLTPEEKSERKDRQEMRERAQKAFEAGADTIHTKLQRKEEKVVGQTIFATDILRFVGMEITNVAKTKLQ
jgi:hypothetical protein